MDGWSPGIGSQDSRQCVTGSLTVDGGWGRPATSHHQDATPAHQLKVKTRLPRIFRVPSRVPHNRDTTRQSNFSSPSLDSGEPTRQLDDNNSPPSNPSSYICIIFYCFHTRRPNPDLPSPTTHIQTSFSSPTARPPPTRHPPISIPRLHHQTINAVGTLPPRKCISNASAPLPSYAPPPLRPPLALVPRPAAAAQ